MTTARKVQLERGDLSSLAKTVGRSAGHLSRVISGQRDASPELQAAIERATGVQIARLRLPGSSGWPKGRRQSEAHRAAIAEGQRRRHQRQREER